MAKPTSKWYRFFEMIPGILIWTSFVVAIILSVYKPLWVVYFIIVYSVLWLFRVFYFVFYKNPNYIYFFDNQID